MRTYLALQMHCLLILHTYIAAVVRSPSQVRDGQALLGVYTPKAENGDVLCSFSKPNCSAKAQVQMLLAILGRLGRLLLPSIKCKLSHDNHCSYPAPKGKYKYLCIHKCTTSRGKVLIAGDSDRRWLCYNLRGGVSLKEDSAVNILDTQFHDTVADNRRVAPYRDYHNLNMAAFGERVGSLFECQIRPCGLSFAQEDPVVTIYKTNN